MKNMKKLLGLVLIFTMCFTSAVFAVDTADTANLENEYLQAILNEIKEQGGYSDEEMATAEIISGSSTQQASLYSTSAESPLIEDAALKIETVENNRIKQDIIVPQTLTEDGQFVNLLALSDTQLIEYQDHPSVNISNNTIIVYNSFYYGMEYSLYDGVNYYQAFGQSCRWTSNNSNATVTNMELLFRATGTEYTWERVGNGEAYEICGYPTDRGVVVYQGTISQSYPVKDQVYNDWSIMFPDNFCIRIQSASTTGQGLVGQGVYTYTINGQSNSETAVWNIARNN